MTKRSFPVIPTLLLASTSPRRQNILGCMGVSFLTVPSGVEEPVAKVGEDGENFAIRLALAKASAVVKRNPGRVVLGADTVVMIDRLILGKPADRLEAEAMLKMLRGNEHEVVTAVALFDGHAEDASIAAVRTRVVFRNFSDDEIDDYIATTEPMDKAGAYAIQSEVFHPAVEIDGCMLNVVGLPACRVADLLAQSLIEVASTSSLAVPGSCRACAENCSLVK